MTTIACFRIANVAMLFGDLLLSSESPPAHALSLPAIGTIAPPKNSNRQYHPVGLNQKVCTINDNLMIAWSGSQFVARSVMKGLREAFSKTTVTWPRLDEFFNDYGVYNLKDSQFIGLYVENGGHSSFGINTRNFDHPILGRSHVGGSGAEKLVAVAELVAGPMHIEGEMRDVDMAITASLTFATQFLAEEMLAGLQETYFGGGFEIGTITQAGAEKVSDILNMFWRYDPKQSNTPLLTPVLIKWDYIGNDLVVQRIKMEEIGERAFGTTEHIVSVVTAPDLKPVNQRPIPPDLNCSYLCNLFYFVQPDLTARSISSVFHSGPKNGPMQFQYREGELATVTLNSAHFEKEWGFVRRAFE